MTIDYSKLIQGLRRASLIVGILSASIGVGMCMVYAFNLNLVPPHVRIEWAWRTALLASLVVYLCKEAREF